MRSELETYEMIDRYLNNQLTGDDLLTFKQKIEDDHAFCQEVETHKLVHDIVIDHGLLEVRKKLRALDSPSAKGNGFIKWIVGIAVITIVSSGIFYPFREENKKISEVTSIETEKVEERTSSNNKPQDQKIIQQPSKKQRQSEKAILPDTITSLIATPTPKENLKTKQLTQPIDTSKTQKRLSPETMSSHTAETACDLALSKILITTVESCYNTPGGKIIIDEKSDLKGKAPFTFSIDRNHYFSKYIFTNLFAGFYELTIRDANGCSWTYNRDVHVGEKDCGNSEYLIYPALSEVWKIPIDDTTNGLIEIFNNGGILVFSAPIRNGFPDTWDGTSNGQPLPMGSYTFLLKSEKSVLTGAITIIR